MLKKELIEKKEAIGFDDHQVNRAKRGCSMEILFKRNTSIIPSPKKFMVDMKNGAKEKR